MAGHCCAVLGSPIRHSLSPVLHRAAYEALGLTGWSYEAHEVDDHQLADFVAGCGSDWVGLSLTMPLKEAVLELGRPSEGARVVGAGNTLIFDHARGCHRVENTDVTGMTAALTRAGVAHARSALVIGAGATARSSLAALAPLGVRTITVMARSAERAHASLDDVAAHFGQRLTVVDWGELPAEAHDVTVATTPAAVEPDVAARIAAASPVVFDIIYHPWPTVLGDAASRVPGCTVLDGMDLLAHQAVDQVRLMTGHDVPVEVLLSAGRSALAARVE
ncbi:shikimate dehydrogenase [Raineyella fluvialis]|uniref:shikimate dehydrogenase (NADP(+)) n=1 Tax=Raineyella fluvialis TaxID=2662261 RepID=A0A5Q2FI53_9ACTN|nr:shikimate dehydrogenase [Raineyella fluvialis]QGF25244.1 shikimate dehydrogenase [Raineyella fluvialis]